MRPIGRYNLPHNDESATILSRVYLASTGSEAGSKPQLRSERGVYITFEALPH